jgi:hypothetical protein
MSRRYYYFYTACRADTTTSYDDAPYDEDVVQTLVDSDADGGAMTSVVHVANVIGVFLCMKQCLIYCMSNNLRGATGIHIHSRGF